MPREELTLAILFADVAKSTHLYETLGNQAAKKLLDHCISVMSKVTAQGIRKNKLNTMGY